VLRVIEMASGDPAHRVGDPSAILGNPARPWFRDRWLEHFQVKWIRFTVENAACSKPRTDSVQTGTALGLESAKLVLAHAP
jgi:hypothetical protein